MRDGEALVRPAVFAHRGLTLGRRDAAGAENTRAAFLRAAEVGASGVELDVRLTRDERLVVHHDEVITGFGAISTRDEASLPEVVPRLEPILRECLSRGLVVNIEIKEGIAYRSERLVARVATVLSCELALDTRLGAGSAAALSARSAPDPAPDRPPDIFAEARIGSPVIVSCFSRAVLDSLLERTDRISCAWLIGPRPPRGLGAATALAASARASGYSGIHPHQRLVGPELVAAAEGAELAVRAWTVDSSRAIRRVAGCRVTAIITNEVVRALRICREPGWLGHGGPATRSSPEGPHASVLGRDLGRDLGPDLGREGPAAGRVGQRERCREES